MKKPIETRINFRIPPGLRNRLNALVKRLKPETRDEFIVRLIRAELEKK